MKRLIFAFLLLQAPLPGSAQTTTANGLLGGLTEFNLNEYENLYDSNGNVVTSRVAKAGDTIQGVFVVTQASNQIGTASYAPNDGSVELTGVFDESVAGFDAAGNYKVVPDTTTTVGAKGMSGSQFQAMFGNGTNNAITAVYYNNNNAMPYEMNGNGLAGLSASQADALARSGTLWATFGASGSWGGGGGYYSTFSGSTAGIYFRAASLGFVDNLTGVSGALFLPLVETPPVGLNSDPGLNAVRNEFVAAASTSPSNINLTGTPFTIFGIDPDEVDCDAAWSSSASGTWSSSSNWTPFVPNGSGIGAVLDAATTAAATITLSAPATVGTLLLGNSAGGAAGYTISGSGGNRLTFNNSGAAAAITLAGGTHAINAPVVLAGSLAVGGSGTLVFGGSGGITGNGGSYSLTMNGPGGTLVLGGSDNYTGGTTVTSGKLIAMDPNAIASGTSLTVGTSASSIFGSVVFGSIEAATGAPTPVPEPSTLALLLAMGGFSLLAGRRTVFRGR